jgi:16S rRNA (guanine1207-N2)-methyltransferase
VPGEGALDPAALLLAEQIELAPDARVLDLNCGLGLTGAVAAGLAPRGRVLLADRNALAVAAARRTLALNGIANAEVWHSNGTGQISLDAPVDAVTVRAPREKLPALQLVWDGFEALRPGGRLYLAGANDAGIKPVQRHAGELFGDLTLLEYRRGNRVAVAVKSADPPPLPQAFDVPWLDHTRWHELAAEARGRTWRIISRPGIFAWDRLDAGTRLLLETMEVGRGDATLDLGCGTGIVGVVAAWLSGGPANLVDADIEAVGAARRTAAANGIANVTVHAGDSAGPVRDLRFQRVLANPPFHTGRAAHSDVATRFIRDAATVLTPGGHLYLVANRHLPYERLVQEAFGSVATASGAEGYKVLVGQKRA